MWWNPNLWMTGRSDRPAGSPTAGEPVSFEAGTIRKPHGVKGEILVDVIRPYERSLKPGMTILVGRQRLPMTLTSLRNHNQGLLIKVEQINNPEEAGIFRLQPFFIPAAQREKLSEEEYYSDEILGMKVSDVEGKDLGTVTEVIETGANDVYVVLDENGREILLPAIPQVIQELDKNNRTMRVHLLPGLIEPGLE